LPVAITGLLTRKRLPPGGGAPGRYLRVAALVFCACGLAWLGTETVRAAWRVTNANAGDPSCVDVGQFARRHLPDNAVLLCEERRGDEHLTIMFYAGRTCYPLGRKGPDETARQILQAGGVPYVVSRQKLALAAVYVSDKPGPTIYLWREQPLSIAPPDVEDSPAR